MIAVHHLAGTFAIASNNACGQNEIAVLQLLLLICHSNINNDEKTIENGFQIPQYPYKIYFGYFSVPIPC